MMLFLKCERRSVTPNVPNLDWDSSVLGTRRVMFLFEYQ